MSDHNIFQRKLELKKHLESNWKEEVGESTKQADFVTGNIPSITFKDLETEIPKESDENDSQAVSLDDRSLNLKTGQVWLDKENKKWKIDTETDHREGFIRAIRSDTSETYAFNIITGLSLHRSVQLISRCEEPVVDTLNFDGCISKNVNYTLSVSNTPQDIINPHSVAFYMEIPEIVGNSKEHLDLIQRNITKLENELRWQRKYEVMTIDALLNK